MKKRELEYLIECYDDKVRDESLISQTPYRKEWIKRFFNTQSQGIAQLNTFLRSASMRKLNSEDEIEGKNLLVLLSIINKQEKNIFGKSCSYENAPKDPTNRVYERLYQLLLFDADIQAGIELPTTHHLYTVLFKHIKHRVISELEKRAQRIFERHKEPQKANSGYLDLGLSLIFDKEIEYSFRERPLKPNKQFTSHTRDIQCDYGSVKVKFIFLNQALYAATLVSAKIQHQNINAGLTWLKLASSNGNKDASLHLAAFYARREDYFSINKKTDPQQTLNYLNLARDQGSLLAAKVLLEKRSFGKVLLQEDGISCGLKCF